MYFILTNGSFLFNYYNRTELLIPYNNKTICKSNKRKVIYISLCKKNKWLMKIAIRIIVLKQWKSTRMVELEKPCHRKLYRRFWNFQQQKMLSFFSNIF